MFHYQNLNMQRRDWVWVMLRMVEYESGESGLLRDDTRILSMW